LPSGYTTIMDLSQLRKVFYSHTWQSSKNT
jgi:hypothetical protein